MLRLSAVTGTVTAVTGGRDEVVTDAVTDAVTGAVTRAVTGAVGATVQGKDMGLQNEGVADGGRDVTWCCDLCCDWGCGCDCAGPRHGSSRNEGVADSPDVNVIKVGAWTGTFCERKDQAIEPHVHNALRWAAAATNRKTPHLPDHHRPFPGAQLASDTEQLCDLGGGHREGS